jgi:hypothetical protein
MGMRVNVFVQMIMVGFIRSMITVAEMRVSHKPSLEGRTQYWRKGSAGPDDVIL